MVYSLSKDDIKCGFLTIFLQMYKSTGKTPIGNHFCELQKQISEYFNFNFSIEGLQQTTS